LFCFQLDLKIQFWILLYVFSVFTYFLCVGTYKNKVTGGGVLSNYHFWTKPNCLFFANRYRLADNCFEPKSLKKKTLKKCSEKNIFWVSKKFQNFFATMFYIFLSTLLPWIVGSIFFFLKIDMLFAWKCMLDAWTQYDSDFDAPRSFPPFKKKTQNDNLKKKSKFYSICKFELKSFVQMIIV